MQPAPSTDILAKLYSSGAYLPLAIVVAFLGLTWASKHLAWLQAPNRVHYVSALLTGIAVLTGPATQGTTPNLSMWIAAIGTIIALVLPGATPAGETPKPVVVDLSNAPPENKPAPAPTEKPQAGYVRLGVMLAIGAIGAVLLFGCANSTRLKTLGGTMATLSAVEITLQTYDANHLAAIAADPKNDSREKVDAATAEWLIEYAKAHDLLAKAAKLVADGYKLDDAPSLSAAELAAADALTFLTSLGVRL